MTMYLVTVSACVLQAELYPSLPHFKKLLASCKHATNTISNLTYVRICTYVLAINNTYVHYQCNTTLHIATLAIVHIYTSIHGLGTC